MRDNETLLKENSSCPKSHRLNSSPFRTLKNLLLLILSTFILLATCNSTCSTRQWWQVKKWFPWCGSFNFHRIFKNEERKKTSPCVFDHAVGISWFMPWPMGHVLFLGNGSMGSKQVLFEVFFLVLTTRLIIQMIFEHKWYLNTNPVHLTESFSDSFIYFVSKSRV